MKRLELTGHPEILEGEGPLGGPRAQREPLVTGGKSYADVNDDVAIHTERVPTKLWIFAFLPSLALMLLFLRGWGSRSRWARGSSGSTTRSGGGSTSSTSCSGSASATPGR